MTNCHWLIIYYLFTIESVYTLVYTRDQWRSAGGGVADRDPQNIWILRKYCGSFGTLTNKANIIILYYFVPDRLSTDSKTRDFEWRRIAILL